MKDKFGNTKPVLIEIGEWWYNGRIIQKQTHTRLLPYISFEDNSNYHVETHMTFREAKQFCQRNACLNPERFPTNYLGGLKS